MKKQDIFLSVTIFSFILFAEGSCEGDNKPQLPPITQTGAGTFGCLVNGEVWVAKNWPFGAIIGASNNQWEDKRWIIDGVGDDFTVIIEICKNSVIIGKSVLTGTSMESCSNGTIINKNDPSSGISSFRTSNTDIGEVLITRYDTIERIISGTFYFDAVNSTGERIEIRNGRFDVKFLDYEP